MKIDTARRLGVSNIMRVGLYRLGLRTGLHPVVRLRAVIGGHEFFQLPAPAIAANRLEPSWKWQSAATYFGWRDIPLSDAVPNWHTNPFLGAQAQHQDQPWWEIPDFAPEVGDIKTVWEPSRFDWLLPMAQRARLGDAHELSRMNDWLADWCRANPAYRGPNWKCGQEASIRVIHLAVAAQLLEQVTETHSDLLGLVEAHMRRIHPTVSYAMGQDNNHGTSEAAGLYIGGHWLRVNGVPEAERWARAGARLLENRIRRLITPDGSFSQYSVNYHRLMLDTLCVVELWRRWHALEAFSSLFYERARAATNWLYAMVNATTGEAPNLGANDGARLLPLVDTDYRDYRPTVQLAMALFADRRAYSAPGLHDTHLGWLDVAIPGISAPAPEPMQLDDGGYALMRKGPWFALLRYPRYQFRPSHCDALHVDLWYGADNVLRDAGSYSYNTDPEWQQYFPGTAAHNTIQFDDRDQMPRLSRFLRGAWLQAHDVAAVKEEGGSLTAAAAYRDRKNATHSRRVQVRDDGLIVHDRIAGFSERAVLRWRLLPDEWELHSEKRDVTDDAGSRVVVSNGPYSLEVQANVPMVRCELVQGWESRYYLQKTPLPVLEVEVRSPGTLTTILRRREG